MLQSVEGEHHEKAVELLKKAEGIVYRIANWYGKWRDMISLEKSYGQETNLHALQHYSVMYCFIASFSINNLLFGLETDIRFLQPNKIQVLYARKANLGLSKMFFIYWLSLNRRVGYDRFYCIMKYSIKICFSRSSSFSSTVQSTSSGRNGSQIWQTAVLSAATDAMRNGALWVTGSSFCPSLDV